MDLQGNGSIGTVLQRMVFECVPTAPPVQAGLSITLRAADDTSLQHQNWILLPTEQAKQLVAYLQGLYP